MAQTIKITVRDVYGVPTIYPACPDAVRFAEIAGTKTLTERTLRLVQALGYTIEPAPTVLRFAA